MALSDEEQVFGARPRAAVPQHEIGQALEALSLAELRERIGLLQAEIVRLETQAAKKETSRRDADAFFSR